MSSYEFGSSYLDPNIKATTYVYDATLGSVIHQNGSAFDAQGRPIDPAAPVQRPAASAPAAAAEKRRPILTHTFEFRLGGSEAQEQALRLDGRSFLQAGLILAIKRVRTYQTRQGEPAPSAIGGVDIGAELRAGGIFCTATLSDFGPGDLVVVQVEVSLY